MFETQLTIIGIALNAPQMRRLTDTGQLAASFRVASTSRRWDKITGEWVDGQSLRVRVTCWRKLAEGAVASVKVGDPVIVVGRLYTRDWVDEQGNRRVLYELDATTVGHDLTRGIAKFTRPTPMETTGVIEDDEEERRIGGEDSVPEAVARPDLPAAGFSAEASDEGSRQGDPDDSPDDEFGDADEDSRVLVPV